jgi:hypothetical protein
MIEVDLSLVPDSRTASGGSAWDASATVAGQMFSARSRHGASHALARVLGAAGVSDQPLIIREAGLRGHLTVRSLHANAGRTVVEGDRPLRQTKWQPRPIEILPRPAASAVSRCEEAVSPVSLGVPAEIHVPEVSRVSVTCRGCGQLFTPKRADARTCGPTCRKRASRASGGPSVAHTRW